MDALWGVLIGGAITGFVTLAAAIINNRFALKQQQNQWERQMQQAREEREAREREREKTAAEKNKETLLDIYSGSLASIAKGITLANTPYTAEIYQQTLEKMYQGFALILIHFPNKDDDDYKYLVEAYTKFMEGSEYYSPNQDVVDRMRDRVIKLMFKDPRIN
jgi:hypothetical protein